jgi:hypothetical protein
MPLITSSNSGQDKEFALAFAPAVDQVFEFIRDNYAPDEVFEVDQLKTWAEDYPFADVEEVFDPAILRDWALANDFFEDNDAPEDVFDFDELEKWALANGFVAQDEPNESAIRY